MNSPIEITICKLHQLPENLQILSDDPQQRIKIVCRQCADIAFNISPIEKTIEQNKEIIKWFESQVKENSIQINLIIDSLISVRETIIKAVEVLIQDLRAQITFSDDLVKLSKINILDVKTIHQIHEQYIQSIKTVSYNSKQKIEIFLNLNVFDKIRIWLLNMNLNGLNEYNSNTTDRFQQSKVEYSLMFSTTLNDQEICENHLFGNITTFKKNNENIIIAACGSSLKVLKQGRENFLQIQVLRGHKTQVCYVGVFEQSKQFFSSDIDGEIRLWGKNKFGWWEQNFLLIGGYHKAGINNIISTQNEDQIISGGQDQTIYMWRLIKKNWILNEQFQCSNIIQNLSLKHPTLNLCLFNTIIQQQFLNILICNGDKFQKFGFRACFLSDDQFAFLPNESNDKLQFYQFNQIKEKFEIHSEMQIKNYQDDLKGVQMKFIPKINLLIVKGGPYLNILRKQKDKNFALEDFLTYCSPDFYGCVSDDGYFLFTLVPSTKIIEVRRLRIRL